jgi:hypothetical protein
VGVDGGAVILRGSEQSWAEKEGAEGLGNTPGLLATPFRSGLG